MKPRFTNHKPCNSLLESAISIVNDGGYTIFPLIPGTKKPLFKDFFIEASNNLQQIFKWWGDCPDAGIGAPTGTINNLVTLDIDGDVGEKSLLILTSENGTLPDTTVIRTGRGRQLCFESNCDLVRNRVGILEGIDFRGNGGYTIFPPSLHPNGKNYQWEICDGAGFAPLPSWLRDLVLTPNSKRQAKDGVQDMFPKFINEGSRNNFLASQTGRLITFGFDPIVVETIVLSLNQRICRPPLDESEVNQIINSIMRTHLRNNGVNNA